MSSAIQISVRELHSRTGHYVRKAASRQRIVVTDRGRPIAELQPLNTDEIPFPARRKLRPGFKKLMESGQLRSAADSTHAISEDRALRDL